MKILEEYKKALVVWNGTIADVINADKREAALIEALEMMMDGWGDEDLRKHHVEAILKEGLK